MTTHVELRKGAYADSVTLLQVSRAVQGVDGVAAAQVAMATALNIEVLTEMGFEVPAEATPNDMVVAVRLAEGGSLDDGAGGRGAGPDRVQPPREWAQRGGAAADHGRGVPPRCRSWRARRDRAGLGARRERLRRGDGRRRGGPRRDGLQRQRAGRAGGRAQAGRRRAGAAGDGPRLRYCGGGRPRSGLRQRRPARSRRSRRRLGHRLPTGAGAARPRRRRGHPRAGRRWPRPVRRGRRAGHPGGAAAAGRGRRASSWSCWSPSRPAARGRGRDQGLRGLARHAGRARAAGRRPPGPHRGDRGGAAPAGPRGAVVAGGRLGGGAVRRPLPARAVRGRHHGQRGEDHRDRRCSARSRATRSWTSATTPTRPAGRTR